MIKKRFRSVKALLAIILIAGLVIGCSNNNGGSNSSTKPSEKATDNSNSTAAPTAAPSDTALEQVTVKVLHNWNGSTGAATDMTPIGEVIKAKTGVTVKWEYTVGSEVEKVNSIFATQDLPDIYTGPAWGGELDGIIKAAKEDQLVDLTDKLAKYPNLSKALAKESVPPALYEKAIGGINGKKYLLYQNQPAKPEDAMDWLYGFYVRKDIAAKVGVDPQKVITKTDLYNFLKKIKDAGLKESGLPVIPLGGFHGGWAVGIGNTMFYGSDYIDKGDGTFEHIFFNKAYEDYTLYYRKLISEGLLDIDAFTQTDPIANEKIKQGRIAVLAAHYPAILDSSKEYVQAHPGSDYVPIGPLERAGAEPNRPADLAIQGNNVTAITKKAKNVDAALRLLEYLASDEGALLVRYGIEGTHWEKVNGKPVAKKEWYDKFTADTSGKLIKSIGIANGYESMSGQDRINSVGGGDIWADQSKLANMDKARKILRPNGISVISAYNPGDVMSKSPQWETLKPSMDQIGDVWKAAIFTKSDAAALKVINDLRGQMNKTGYPEAIKYTNENLKGKEVVKFGMPN